MKVIRDKEEFKPITLIIESQEELDCLWAALAASDAQLSRTWEDCKVTETLPLDTRPAYAMFTEIDNLDKLYKRNV